MFYFEWDSVKDLENQLKHGVSFELAQRAFEDENRILLPDRNHSLVEERWFCLGLVDSRVLAVRFTYRRERIRIIGAGFWRRGRKIYEQANQKEEAGLH